ncbi:MAG: HAMP domain-containing sensor histidine kinase, partial [Ilumatobacteraceae bacterium]
LKNSFIENMNHELRTPLTSIIGYLEVIMDDVDADKEPDLASSLVAVQRNALRLQILIENMMQISRTDFEHVPLVLSTVDVGHLLGDAISSLQLSAEDGGVSITIRLESPAGDLIIDGDVNQLEQVFVNLLSNAIKFTPRDGSVTLVARRNHAEGDYVEVKVIDTGIGIPAKEFPNVFQRFFRASTATSASIPGFGIGLSLVQSIVREHNGTVTFDSTEGVGTTFTVKLPARQHPSRSAKVST